jgi:hypothetical protein
MMIGSTMTKAFEHTLTEMRDGRVVERLTDEWGDLIAAIRNTGKSGSMTVTFSVKPSGENGMEVDVKVSTKAPKPQIGAAFFFIDSNGDLSRKNERQLELFQGNVTKI